MKRLLFICMLVILFSCEKETILPCEYNQTFTLRYWNNRGYTINLIVGKDRYQVVNQKLLILTVPVELCPTICVILNSDTLSRMSGRPNPCANYNFFQ